MRDLTPEELKLAPAGCDYYNIIDGKVYFTDVLGIDVFDINGNEVDNCIMDDKVFVKSVPLPKKPFDISEHEFSCENFKACKPSWVGNDLQIEIIDSDFTHHDALLSKQDAIAIAKALGVTGEDLK